MARGATPRESGSSAAFGEGSNIGSILRREDVNKDKCSRPLRALIQGTTRVGRPLNLKLSVQGYCFLLCDKHTTPGARLNSKVQLTGTRRGFSPEEGSLYMEDFLLFNSIFQDSSLCPSQSLPPCPRPQSWIRWSPQHFTRTIISQFCVELASVAQKLREHHRLSALQSGTRKTQHEIAITHTHVSSVRRAV